MIQTEKVSMCDHGVIQAHVQMDVSSVDQVCRAMAQYAAKYEVWLLSRVQDGIEPVEMDDLQLLSEMVEAATEWNCLLDECIRMGVQVDVSEAVAHEH